MTRISSVHNPAVKYVRSLERGRTRREEGVYLAEGVRLVGEALTTRQTAPLVLYDPDLLKRSAVGTSLLAAIPDWAERSYEVEPAVLTAAAQTETPAGVLAVLRLPSPGPLSSHASDRLGLILDRLADPGNAGTILRTAVAAGVDYVIAAPDTTDLFAPKVVRAGMGAHFRLPVYSGVSWEQIDAELPDVPLIATTVEGCDSIYRFKWPDRSVLIVGSEAHGLSPDARRRASRQVHIPMRQGVESLNASVAASLAIYAALGPTLNGPSAG